MPRCLAELHERREPLADAAEFGGVLLVGVFLDREFFAVRVVARIDAHFVHPLRGFHGGVGFEMDVGDDRHVAAALPQTSDDVLQIGGVFHRGSGDAHDLAADRDEVERLLDRSRGVHGVACDHGLHPDRVIAAEADVADHDFASATAWRGVNRGRGGRVHGKEAWHLTSGKWPRAKDAMAQRGEGRTGCDTQSEATLEWPRAKAQRRKGGRRGKDDRERERERRRKARSVSAPNLVPLPFCCLFLCGFAPLREAIGAPPHSTRCNPTRLFPPLRLCVLCARPILSAPPAMRTEPPLAPRPSLPC